MNAERLPHERSELDERILIVRHAKPKHGTQSPLGVIVLGIGVADLIATARFARYGWPAVQVRLISETTHHDDLPRRYATYDSSGVSRCEEAMDYLTRTEGIRRFILMGSCALANICVNVAISDARVAGLILTNLYVPERPAARMSLRIRKHLFNPQSWLRLLRGKMQVRQQLDPAEVRLRDSTGDVALPADLPDCLERLTRRGMRTLIAFSRSEPALFQFKRYYSKDLRRLVGTGQFRFEVLATDSHDFSATEEAAAKLNALIGDWIQSSWSSVGVLPDTARPAVKSAGSALPSRRISYSTPS